MKTYTVQVFSRDGMPMASQNFNSRIARISLNAALRAVKIVLDLAPFQCKARITCGAEIVWVSE